MPVNEEKEAKRSLLCFTRVIIISLFMPSSLFEEARRIQEVSSLQRKSHTQSLAKNLRTHSCAVNEGEEAFVKI